MTVCGTLPQGPADARPGLGSAPPLRFLPGTSGGSRAYTFAHISPGRPDMRRTLTRSLVAAALATLALAAPAKALEVGQKAPDFTLTTGDGKKVQLADLLGKGPVVIYTFIQAFTPT